MINKILKTSSYLLLIMCLVLSNLYVPEVQAKTLGDIKSELAKFEEDYNNNQLEKELNEKEKKQIQSNITSISNQIGQVGIDIDNLNKEIENLKLEIEKDEGQIADILAFTQVQNGESAYLEYAFGAQDFTDFIYRIAVSEQITSYNNELIETNKNNIEENKRKTAELATKKAQLADKQVELGKEMAKIQSSLSEIDEEMLTIKQQIDARKSQIKIYSDKGCKDNEDIDSCGLNILPPDTSFWRPVSAGMIAGSLGWYGPRKPCGNGVSCYHYGLDITTYNANQGTTPVYAAANGIVMYVVPLSLDSNGKQCAGRKIYIQHNVNGKLYTTGYLHMHEVWVKEGQTVSKDTQIGIMGGFESYDSCSTGGHLHFEMSTGKFAGNVVTYYTNRYNPTSSVNFPSQASKYWNDRVTKLN